MMTTKQRIETLADILAGQICAIIPAEKRRAVREAAAREVERTGKIDGHGGAIVELAQEIRLPPPRYALIALAGGALYSSAQSPMYHSRHS